jgi:hypothetical protein
VNGAIISTDDHVWQTWDESTRYLSAKPTIATTKASSIMVIQAQFSTFLDL